MRMRNMLLWSLAASMLLCPLLVMADDPVLVITEKGYYYLRAGADGTPTYTEAPAVVILGKPNVPDPPGPGDPSDPPTGDAVTKVADMSKRVLKDAKEAEVLAYVVQALYIEGKASGLSDVKAALREAIGVVKLVTNAGKRYDDWLKELDSLVNLGSIESLKTAVSGLAQGFDLNLKDLVVGATYAIGGADSERTLAALEKEPAIDIALIIQLILKVLELLRDLGILK